MTALPSARVHAARTIAALLRDRPRPGETRQGPSLDPRDERFAAELSHGVVRHISRIDWIIADAAGKPTSRISPPALAAARIGVYQLLFTPGIPPYAAISTSVDLARDLAPNTAGFVNWLLRRVGPDAAARPRREEFRDDLPWLAAYHSFPPWMVKRWARRLGKPEAERLLAAMNTYPPPHVRVNRGRSATAELHDSLAAAGLETGPGRYAPDALHVLSPGAITSTAAFFSGEFYIQDESSQLAALALAPRPGERILDACAGVGGKTTQIAELAGNSASVVAVDADAGRLALLADNARRLGAAGIEMRCGDLLDPALLDDARFDAVLLDAPCSALGTIPRHPEVKWSKRAADPRRLADLQLRLLGRAAELLAGGGRIVYSTCSTEPEEGEEVIGRFLAAHPGFRVADIGGLGITGIMHLEELSTREGFIRTWPHRHGIGGAFVALLRSGNPPDPSASGGRRSAPPR